MKLSRNWVGGFGLATLTSIIGVAACGGGDDPQPQPSPPPGGSPSVGGTPPVGGSSAGTPTVIAGGGTGGSAGSVSVAGSAGAATGGSGGAGAAGAPGGFACDAKAFNCAKIESFGAPNEAGFGSGDFQGGVSVFGGLTRVDEVDKIHVKGKVDNYGRGFNIWFNYCTDFTDVTGVTFTLNGSITSGAPAGGAGGVAAGGSGGASAGAGGASGGTGGSSAGAAGASGGSGGAATAPTELKIDFQLQTNSNYPWQPFQNDPNNKKGACTIPDADFQADMNAVWSACVPSSKDGIPVPATPTPVSITFATDLKGGKPKAWSEAGIHEIVGLQWQFPWAGSKATPYEIDVTVDNVTFISATQTGLCPEVGGAAGGAGGTGGSGGASGGASGGSGGASAGTGGASAGTAGG